MRKIAVVAVLVISAVMFSAAGFAEESGKMGSTMHKQMMKCEEGKEGATGDMGMMMSHGKMKGICPMHGMMMKSMVGREMVATEDGGVAVLSGNKLIKFDKDLNLVKETELKPDMEGMQEMMGCGMMQGAKEKSAEAGKTDITSEHKPQH